MYEPPTGVPPPRRPERLPVWALGWALGVLASVAPPACAPTPPPIQISAVTAPVPTLGPGDIFEARIFGESELTGLHRVASDGTINFPLIGTVEVGGLTPADASRVIAEGLKRFLRDPQVSLMVKEYNSKKVYVFGEVKKPGTFPYEDGMNIIQAITLAGGFDRFADAGGAFVTRIVDGQEQRLRVSVKEIGEGSAPNFELEPGDIVFVPESLF